MKNSERARALKARLLSMRDEYPVLSVEHSLLGNAMAQAELSAQSYEKKEKKDAHA